MVKEYLISLKNKGNFSWSDLSRLSGLPDATIRKIFSGETEDPRFETVVKLVTAMGGSMDEMIGGTHRDHTDEHDHDRDHDALVESYEARIAELKTSAAAYVESLRKAKRNLSIAVYILGAILLGMLLVDLFVGNVGWVQY